MARRIEVELTSTRDDSTWTWRAAGARQPKGVVAAALLPEGAAVGDVLRADAEFTVDGIEIIGVLPPKAVKAPKVETLELIGSRRDEPLVTSTLVGKRGRSRDDDDRGPRKRRDDRGGRGGRDGRDGSRGDGASRDGANREGKGRHRRDDDRGGRRPPRERPPREEAPARPAAKRLRAGRGHRNALLRELPEEQRPLAEIVLRGGVPALRQILDRQHETAKAQGQPALRSEPLLALAERLLPRLKAAEWHDRADAALRQVDEVDLRDLRSVVSAAETAARDDESRAVAEQLRAALTARVDREHQEWLDELGTVLEEGRVVRALRLSSRPPKAGAPLPPDIAAKLAEQATTALTADVSQDRFATLLDAVSFSPVHARVAATSIPTKPTDELLRLVKKVASRVPAVAAQFGIGAGRPASSPAAAPAPAAVAPAAPAPEAPAPEAPAPEAPAPEAAAAEPAASAPSA
jgi:hypothetical protein